MWACHFPRARCSGGYRPCQGKATGFGIAQLDGLPNHVQFEAVGGANRANDGVPEAAGSASAQALIVFPSIVVSKRCVNASTPYGQPILFAGTVTNTGDITLTNVHVIDTPLGLPPTDLALANFGDRISAGGANLGPFARTLNPGDWVSFSGSYSPANLGGASLCGPFTNTVVASGTDSNNATGFIPKTVSELGYARSAPFPPPRASG